MTRFATGLVIGTLALAGALLGCDQSNNQSKPATPAAAGSTDAVAPVTHKTTGRIEAVDPVAGSLKIHHAAVPSISWPAMTMDFLVSDKTLLNNVKSGQEIEFEFYDRGGDYVVTSVKAKQ